MKDEIEKKKLIKKNYSSQSRLTCQTRGLDHEMWIISRKHTKVNCEAQFLINSVLKDKIKKKLIKKNYSSQSGLTCPFN